MALEDYQYENGSNYFNQTGENYEPTNEYFSSIFLTTSSPKQDKFSFRFGYDEAKFYLVSAYIVYETICIFLFLYSFIKTLIITSHDHKTIQYKKYQWLRILLILLSTCYILKAFVFLFEFPDYLKILHQIIEFIATFADTLFAISTVIVIWQIAILCNRYSPKSFWYKVILIVFVILCFVMNILDILRVIYLGGEKEQLYTNLWGYFQFSIVPFGAILSIICLQYYARLMRYVKGEAMVAQSIMLDDFRSKMVDEYKRACKLLLCLVAFFIVWLVLLITMSVNEINKEYLKSIAFWSIFLSGSMLHRIGFCYYLWVRYDPVEQDDFIRKSQEMSDNASNGTYDNMLISRNIDEVRM